jgi:type VI secretion system protein ImpJ
MTAQTRLPINWEQGLFLQPQHFQLTDLYHQYLLAARMQFISPNFWGIVDCEIDEGLLENSIFSIKSGTFVTQQGAVVQIPVSCQLAPRSFADQTKAGVTRCQVYLGIKEFSTVEANVTEASGSADVNTRFVSTEGADEEDLYNKGPQANVKQLKYAAKIFWDTEAAQVQNYVLLPVATLIKTADKITLDPDFIPVCLNIKASSNLFVKI